jgi:hypothetical protein
MDKVSLDKHAFIYVDVTDLRWKFNFSMHDLIIVAVKSELGSRLKFSNLDLLCY